MENQTIWFNERTWYDGVIVYSISERKGRKWGLVDWNGFTYVVRYSPDADWPVWEIMG